jgi:phosphoribosylformylglycinamidine synthase subunit PurQ / glutaminase
VGEQIGGGAVTTPQVLVLAGLGINCERETAAAFRLAGANADTIHINALFEDITPLHQAQIVAFPGGFAFGDRLGAGQALANRIRHRHLPNGQTLLSELVRFVERGGFILGICNGFQVLAKLGLVPNVRGDCTQEVALAENASARFENRWCHLTPAKTGPMKAFAPLGQIELPARHGEGRLVFRDESIRQAVIDQSLSWLTYSTVDGSPATQFPENPNGADLACAGLSDPTGHVIGLMPHPEAYVSPYTHYDWPRRRREGRHTIHEGDGLRLIRTLVRRSAQGSCPALDRQREEL